MSGTVTDAETGKPLSGVSVALTGPFERTVTTDADGDYSVLAIGGDYDIRASLFGYDAQDAEVSVTVDQTTRHDIALSRAPSATVSGTVTDGSGHGWPLYAEVKVDGPAGSYFTEPTTGDYSITLPSNATYTVTVSSQYPGYETQTSDVTLSGGDVVHDVALPVDSSTCTAAGYEFHVDGWTEDFDAGTRPAGWTVTDPLANGKVWRFDNPRNRENLTGGEGEFAILDSSYYGNSYQDSALVSPVFDLSETEAPVVGFKQDLDVVDDVADVDVSIDGGATWQNVLRQRIRDRRGPREEILELPTAAGESQVQVRFHHHNARYDWWWQVDNFFIGERTCDPVEGGLVLGQVSDANTDQGLAGATVRSVDVSGLGTTTAATAADRGLGDGFYWMFTEHTGEHSFEAATGDEYGTQDESVSIAPDDATELNFELAAGRLRITPADPALEMKIGQESEKQKVTITNEGGRPASIELSERNGSFVMQGETERRGAASHLTGSGAPPMRLDVPVSLTPSRAVPTAETQARDVPNEAPWTGIADLTEEAVDNRAVTIDGLVYSLTDSGSGTPTHLNVYDPQTDAWTSGPDLPAPSSSGAVGAVDGRLVVVGGWTGSGSGIGRATWIYDPAAGRWSRGADAPAPRSASGFAVVDDLLYVVGGCTSSRCAPMSSDVTAYDVTTDTWTEVADYPEPLAYVGCGGIDGAIYCTGGSAGGLGSPGTARSYSYDPERNAWASLPDAPADTWGSQVAPAGGLLVVNGGVQRGAITNSTVGYDPAVGTWSTLPNSNTARYRGAATCGFYKLGGARAAVYGHVDAERLPGLGGCGATDVEWMSVDTETVTLEPGESVRVAVTMDPDVEQPGSYTAAIRVRENTPYAVDPLVVTMTVTAPDWGKVEGIVTGQECDGTSAPLTGATVEATGRRYTWLLATGAEGGFASWFPSASGPLDVVVEKDGYATQAQRVTVASGRTSRLDVTLRRSCG